MVTIPEVFIVCPANAYSGGPELCHQLADAINRTQPGRAALLLEPFERRHTVAPSYRHYDAPTAGVDEVPLGAVVVLPEVFGRYIKRFAHARIYYWWMSVNNYHREAPKVDRQLDLIRRHVRLHLYQSQYARQFCDTIGLWPTAPLSDKLSDEYLGAIANPPTAARRDIIAFNPRKGIDRTRLIMGALVKGLRPAPEIIELDDLTPDQVRQVFSEVKCYIDFGGHPGKDRLPREAAACGACVITNQRGSAANDIDVPIPADYKIDDRYKGFERRAVRKIHQVIDDYDIERHCFDTYRKVIAAEPARFDADVAALFPVKVDA